MKVFRCWMLLTLLVVCVIPDQARAEPPGDGGPFGLGIMLGLPTALTAKYWIDKEQALDFHIGADDFGNGGTVGFYGDYLFHIDVGVKTPYFRLPLYVGPGAALLFNDRGRYCTFSRCRGRDELALAARVPFGVAFLFKKFNGEAFVELATQLFLVPFVDFDLGAAVGFRFYF